ncbi:MAG: hypothetical protein ACN4GT_13075 [Gammaproteobacteria bacterium]
MIIPFQHRITKIVAALLACSTCFAGPAGADISEDIGRLFLTPSQRAALDAERQNKPAMAQVDAYIAPRPDAIGRGDSITVNGVIRRSRGPSTVWINGRAVNEDTSADTGIDLRSGPDSTSRVLLSTGDGRSLALKPGQVWLRDSGRILDCTTCASPAKTAPDEPDAPAP